MFLADEAYITSHETPNLCFHVVIQGNLKRTTFSTLLLWTGIDFFVFLVKACHLHNLNNKFNIRAKIENVFEPKVFALVPRCLSLLNSAATSAVRNYSRANLFKQFINLLQL